MNRLLAGRRQFARARFLSSLLIAGLAAIALPQPAPAGTLQVQKVVTGSLSPQPTATFTLKVDCAGFPSNALNLTNGGTLTLPAKPPGTVCTVREPTLPPPFMANGQTCTWQPVPNQTVTMTVLAISATVHNTYQCQGGTGVLKVTKLVAGSLSPQPTAQFQIMAICPPTPSQGILLQTAGSYTTGAKPYGTVCQVAENTLPPPFVANGQNCTWYRVSPQTQTVSINSPTNLVTVQNSYQCQGGVGTLVVKKIVTGTLSPQPTTSFGINVSCQGSTAWALNLANGGSSSLSPISIGKTCTITEPTLPPPFQAAGKTCTWHHVPATQTVPINGPSQIVVVNNSYTCV